MLTITPEAIRFLQDKGQPVYLDHPSVAEASTRPSKKLPQIIYGMPKQPENFELCQQEGVMVYVPRIIWHIPITMAVSSFFTYKNLYFRVDEGKRLKRS